MKSLNPCDIIHAIQKTKGGDFLEPQDVLNRAKQAFSKANAGLINKIKTIFTKKTPQSKFGSINFFTLAPVFVLGLLFFSLFYVQWSKPVQMYIDGSPAALVASEAEALAAIDLIKEEMSTKYSEEAKPHYEAKLSFSKSGVDAKATTATPEELAEVLCNQLKWSIAGTTIEVNKVQVAVLSSTVEAEQALEAVKKAYLPDENKVKVLEADFVEAIEVIKKEDVLIADLCSKEKAVQLLTTGKEKIEEYQLQEGDSLWTIARANDTTVEALQSANPHLGKTLQIGDVVKLAKAEPLVSVKQVVEAVKEENIPYDTVYEKDSNSYKGQQSVLKKGTEGKKEVTYQIAQINGVELERKVIAETVIAEPVDKIVKTGTKTIVASRGGGGSGILSWPLRGRINSAYGRRSRGQHTGIDIDANKGDPIYSASGGTIIKSAYSGGYGNCIMIDHGDGLVTLYAHLSKRNVTVGQKVGKNELIGLAGSTGNSTGAHLHFEVRVNGKFTNPMNYLN